jgi:hypothetical protein
MNAKYQVAMFNIAKAMKKVKVLVKVFEFVCLTFDLEG